MADVSARLYNWSSNEASNSPSGSTTIGPGLDDNLRQIQATVRAELAKKGSDIASAATTDLGATAGNSHDITGTTTITSFGTVDSGIWKVLQFNATCTLKYNASSLILPSAADITAQPTDCLYAFSLGSGNWRVPFYQKANGKALVNDDLNFSQTSVGSTADLMPIWAVGTTANRSITAKNFFNVLNQVSTAALDTAADYVFFYDTSASAMAKVLGSSMFPAPTASQGASWVLLQTQSISALAACDFVHGVNGCVFDSTYDHYVLKMTGIRMQTNGAYLMWRVTENSGSAYKAGGTDYSDMSSGYSSGGAITQNGTNSGVVLAQTTNGMSNSAAQLFDGELVICNPTSAAAKNIYGRATYTSGTAAFCSWSIGGMYTLTTNTINGFRIVASSGQITNGTFALYGIKKS